MADLKHIEILLDGQMVSATEGETVLSVAKRVGVYIPSLCHHDALIPSGACRLCLVEIAKENGLDHREKDVVAACQYPVSKGLIVRTNTPRVLGHRRIVISLLLAKAPETPLFKALARSVGKPVIYRESERKDSCILCTLCTRTCAATGANALSTSGRGYEKMIAPPYRFGEGGCIGCGACFRACPTGHIAMTQTDDTRVIWDHVFERIHCKICGAPTVTKEQLQFLTAHSGLSEDYFIVCASCKQKETAKTFAKVSEPLPGGSDAK